MRFCCGCINVSAIVGSIPIDTVSVEFTWLFVHYLSEIKFSCDGKKNCVENNVELFVTGQ